MSNKKPDGGCAFPTTKYFDEKPCDIAEGMTIRDYFAAAALQGLLANPADFKCDDDEIEDVAAELAYGYADAMIKAGTK